MFHNQGYFQGDTSAIATETACACQAFVHYQSHLLLNCGLRLTAKVLLDSKLSQNINYERTKSESIVENILAPYLAELLLDDLRQ